MNRELEDLNLWYRDHLEAENKAPSTIRGYTDAPRHFDTFLQGIGHDGQLAAVGRKEVQDFIRDQAARLKPHTALNRYRSLRHFFNWCVEQQLLPASPMAGMKEPHVPHDPPPVMDDADLKKLLKVCEGQSYQAIRDTAIIRLLLTGMRRGEIAGIMVADLHFGGRDGFNSVTVNGKTGRRTVPFGFKTAKALHRYIHVRRQRSDAHLPNLWLGKAGPMQGNGIYQMVKSRAEQAGLGRVWVHLFRHTAADIWLDGQGNEHDLATLMGWKGTQMVARYGASNAVKRAMKAHRRILPDDRV